jgi:hypothetical protein
VGDRALTLAAAQVSSGGGSSLTKRGAARAHSRALREGGLSFAMKGVKLSSTVMLLLLFGKRGALIQASVRSIFPLPKNSNFRRRAAREANLSTYLPK